LQEDDDGPSRKELETQVEYLTAQLEEARNTLAQERVEKVAEFEIIQTRSNELERELQRFKEHSGNLRSQLDAYIASDS